MKTAIKTILIGVSFLAAAGQVYAYPPDNAAVLYYKTFLMLEEPNDTVAKMLSDLLKGNIGLNEQIRQYVEKNRRVIKYAMTAAEVESCDWGLDYSEGAAMVMPHLSKCRQLAKLLMAEAKVLTEKGDYKEALERCVATHKMAKHSGDDALISYLMATSINEFANKEIIDILSQMPVNLDTLVWFQSQMAGVSDRKLSLESVWAKETEMSLREMEKIDVLLEQMGDGNKIDSNPVKSREADELSRRMQQRDEAFFQRSRENFAVTMAAVQAAFELPYPQAHEELTRLFEKKDKDAKEKPEAILTGIFCPSVAGFSSIRAARETFFNAVEAAVVIYIDKAKTGKLPDELPAGLPKDMFSGKDFLYEKTAAGFILKCQGKNLTRNIVHQFEFKVAK